MGVKITADWSGLNKLVKQMKESTIEVGWTKPTTHWTGEMNVPSLAGMLHDHSRWAGTFMLSASKSSQVRSVIGKALRGFDLKGFPAAVADVGEALKDAIVGNIIGVTSPPNDDEWASYKGFNDPLVFGSDSRVGKTPNLISEVSWQKVGK
jgi:hypothetical protein